MTTTTNDSATNVALTREQQILALTRRGLRIFRVHPGTKRPLRSGWQQEATSDPEKIASLWTHTPDADVGVATGQGVAVVDVDFGHGYVDVEAIADLPLATLIVQTRSGGHHRYYYVDEPVRNSAGKLADGVDVRGDGGFVVAPPSSGYQIIADRPLAYLPAARLREVKGSVRRFPRARDGFAWCPPGETVPAGARHDYILRAGARLAEIAEGDPESLSDLVHGHAAATCDPPLDESEVDKIVDWLVREVL